MVLDLYIKLYRSKFTYKLNNLSNKDGEHRRVLGFLFGLEERERLRDFLFGLEERERLGDFLFGLDKDLDIDFANFSACSAEINLATLPPHK